MTQTEVGVEGSLSARPQNPVLEPAAVCSEAALTVDYMLARVSAYRKTEEQVQEKQGEHPAGIRTRTGSANSPPEGLLAILIAKRPTNEKGTGFEPVPFSFSGYPGFRRGVRVGALNVLRLKMRDAPGLGRVGLSYVCEVIAGVSPAGVAWVR